MNFLQDWKFYLFVIAICQIALTTYGFAIIKFNDLKHLSIDVGDIKTDVKETKTDVKELSSKVAVIDKGLAVQKQRIKDLEKSIK